MWPAIWLLPEYEEFGPWPASGEIDLMESRGNDSTCAAGGRNTFASTLHWGPNWDANKYELTTKQYVHDSDLSDDFHTYGLIWTDSKIQTYIDDPSNIVLDVEYGDQGFWDKGGFAGEGRTANPWVGEPNAAPFNRNFYLILNVAVGGTNGFFPDNECGKTWTSVNDFWNQYGEWWPTWEYPETTKSAMKIDWI